MRDDTGDKSATEAAGFGKVYATAEVGLTNATGLHARPSIKLTKLAKTFAARIELTIDTAGSWVDAKSIVKVMATKAARGTVLHLRAEGVDAEAALAALVALATRNFDEAEPRDG
jgi:phosphocarrier protein